MGMRNLEGAAAAATLAGFAPPVIERMPDNNLALIFRRQEAANEILRILRHA
jgi:hypothetical protein